MSRGCITVMEEGSFAANGIKHCIRPVDMTGKSAAFILRQMHPDLVEDALKYDQFVDLPLHLSTLSIDEQSVGFNTLKALEADSIFKKKSSN